MKLINKDYPFTIMIEDKVGKTSGKMYQSVSVGYTSVKNKEATDPKEKYQTNWLNFFSEMDLLKLATLANTAYGELKAERGRPKEDIQVTHPANPIPDDLNDDIPF